MTEDKKQVVLDFLANEDFATLAEILKEGILNREDIPNYFSFNELRSYELTFIKVYLALLDC